MRERLEGNLQQAELYHSLQEDIRYTGERLEGNLQQAELYHSLQEDIRYRGQVHVDQVPRVQVHMGQVKYI